MSDDAMQRARMLLSEGQSERALEYLSKALAEHPDDAEAHAFRALALADLSEYEDALESASRASGEAPDWAFPHYVTARVLIGMDKPKRALDPAKEAVALDPDDEDHFAMLSACYVGLNQWQRGLEAAENGLALRPEHVQCTNLRALCLRMLGSNDEAVDALRTSLATDPDNAWTHQSLGWSAIGDGRFDDAIESFRESLRLDPTDDDARVGLATAIKGKVPLFRPLLAWQLFSAKLSDKLGFGLVIGLVILNRVVQSQLGPDSALGTILLIAYVSFVWMSWAGNALFDVLLALRKDWRPILTEREKAASFGVIACLLLAAVALGLRAWTGLRGSEWIACAFAFTAIPTASWANMPNAKARTVGAIVALGAFLLALGSLALHVFSLDLLGWDLERRVSPAELEKMKAAVTPHLERSSQLSLLSVVVSVGSTWLFSALSFVPEGRGGRGTRRRPRSA
ncbi:MAG: tetratricopeptide repeat protein [Planctomycetota bacterium]